VDLARNRIALSMKAKPDGGASGDANVQRAPRRDDRKPAAKRAPSFVPRSGAVAPNGMRFK
jgi:hypothetical protein